VSAVWGPGLERTLEGMVLCAAAWPAFGLLARRSFRNAFPAFARYLAGLLVLYLAGLVLLAVMAPAWLVRCAAAGALAVLGVVHWHSAVARGRAHGWPPGSLQPLAAGPLTRQNFFLEQFRRLGSPFKTSQFLRPTACLVGLADGLAFFHEHDESLASPPWAFGRFIPGGFLRHMPRRQHAAARDVFRSSLVREVYQPQEAFIRDVFRRELAVMAQGSRDGGVPPRRHVQRAVFTIWVRLFFGIERDSADCAQLASLYKIIDIRNPMGASDRQIRNAVDAVIAIARRQVDRDVDGDRPRSFLHAMARTRPGSADDPTMIGNLVYMLHTTWADVSGLLQWVTRLLTDHGEWADRLRQARGTGDNGSASLSTRVVMETLRLEQSEYLYRVATADIDHNGFRVPKGWLVRLCVRESHQDPTVFEEPAVFNPDRFLHRTFTRREYAPFGAGLRHACLGEQLTRTVASIFVEELARGYVWHTVTDGPPEHSAWRHWRPSSGWRIALTARDAPHE